MEELRADNDELRRQNAELEAKAGGKATRKNPGTMVWGRVMSCVVLGLEGV